MESGAGSWTSGGTLNEWQIGSIAWGSAYSGGNCWGTDINTTAPGDNDEYENNCNQWLRTPSINLVSVPSATLNFMHKYRIRDYDYAYLEISTNGGGSWTQLRNYSTGNQNTWTKITISLNSYAGNNIILRYRLQSDSSIVNKGWYIDDVNVSCS
jgi:bacillopeptidase F